MQNVKILTFHNAENYGATLQAYALKQTLKKLGVNPEFVNYENKKILSDYKLIRTNSLKSFFSSLWYLPRNLKRKRSFKSFSDAYLDTDKKKYYSCEEIEKDIEPGDVFVAGSDQIWNPELTGGLSDVYTLNFNRENIKKITYGASLGNEELLKKYASDFKSKLAGLDLISAREQSVIKPLEEISNKKVEQVVDPTLLQSREKWDKLISENDTVNLPCEKYILVYTLFENDEVTKIANYLSKVTGLKIVHFRKYNAYENELMSLYSKGPVDFVNAFKNAGYVVTNSFHGTVFSLIYERKFYSVLPKERAGRIKDLLGDLELGSRIVQDVQQINLEDEIDYTTTKDKIESLKAKSIEYLKKGIDYV
ncbi:MAG: polysaccharide pyruvyl transferase family protein [Clostridia bacterium]|nr:polysaccharide pyruvyl transferase family protein [Clostridia bacterium]